MLMLKTKSEHLETRYPLGIDLASEAHSSPVFTLLLQVRKIFIVHAHHVYRLETECFRSNCYLRPGIKKFLAGRCPDNGRIGAIYKAMSDICLCAGYACLQSSAANYRHIPQMSVTGINTPAQRETTPTKLQAVHLSCRGQMPNSRCRLDSTVHGRSRCLQLSEWDLRRVLMRLLHSTRHVALEQSAPWEG